MRLAQAYADILAGEPIQLRRGADPLLTLGDTEERARYLNARATLRTLLGLGAVPVINENDTVATAEIRFGDNDRLAARVASMMEADCLVLLSDVDGLYTADPTRDASAKHIAIVDEITPSIEAMAGRSAIPVLVLRRHGVEIDRGQNRHASGLSQTTVIAAGAKAADIPLDAISAGAQT